MLTVDEFARIRRADRDGMSIRAIARTFGHARKSVRKALKQGEPPDYTLSRPRPAPKLGTFHAVIDQILAEDEHAPPKQRHTAMQIYRRLCGPEHGYTGGYDQVRRYVARQRQRDRATFIPLDHEPGQRLEADFGHIHVDYPEGRRLKSVLLTTWSYSHARFAIAMPTERTEAILAGLVAAFEFFGCVARQLWWDNPKTVAKTIFKGRQRQLNERYAALVSHYALDPQFCLPRSGWEKPDVEHSVFDLQRRWATPVPKVRNDDELNAYLLQCCINEMQRTVAGQTQTIGQRFEQDKAASFALPPRPFDPCIRQPAKVDKYQTVAFDTNRYSVPRRLAFGTVTVKGYIDRVVFVCNATAVAEHRRDYERGQLILDPLHYLVTLGRRPAALDHAPVYRDWRLPAVFTDLREKLEQRHGPRAGARQFIRVLQLLAEHPVGRVQRAIEQVLATGVIDAEPIITRTQRLAQRRHGAVDIESPASQANCRIGPQVPLPDLNQFNQLLASGVHGHDHHDQPQRTSVAQDESQGTALAHHGP